jgi:hypothetical protein
MELSIVQELPLGCGAPNRQLFPQYKSQRCHPDPGGELCGSSHLYALHLMYIFLPAFCGRPVSGQFE